MIKRIFDHTLSRGEAYKNLEFLCKKIGPRLSGSEGAKKAVDFTKTKMESYSFNKVFLQDVKVPHWERGERRIIFLSKWKKN